MIHAAGIVNLGGEHHMSVRQSKHRLVAVTASIVTAAALAGCSPTTDAGGNRGTAPAGGDAADGGSAGSSDTSATAPSLSVNVARGETGVPVSTIVSVDAEGGSLQSVEVSSTLGAISGSMSSDQASWRARERLEPATTYTVSAVAQNGAEGAPVRRTSRFTTQDLSLAQQTFGSVAPLQGETVGVGMPVVVSFDLPIRRKAAFEKSMSVTSQPRQAGAWHWLSETEVHWRPRTYWKAGTEVSVDLGVNGLDAGDGIYGQQDRDIEFTVGDANVYRVDARTYQMKVLSNGELLRTIPITTGKAGFTTRSGTKVIMEKFETKRMDSETVGISGSEAYDIADVQYAMRLTHSGEFIHAAPWSVGSQGSANVSHGCTGLSTDQARWLYSISKRGDVVEYTGTDRPMTLTNGFGDWNESFERYARGSAL